jgi:uncharacterized caspase-like protein
MAKRALCVGINQFSHLPMASWLNGCVNDATDMAAMLRKRGFAPRAITVLTDAQATKANVMGALTKLVETAKEGDHIVFSFSSHGTQVPDTDGDAGRPEPDGADEAFACHDIAQKGDQWDTDTVIVDDELRVLFGKLPKGVLMEAFLDTCHSGDGLRAEDLLSGRRPRFVPPPTLKGLRAIQATATKSSTTELVKAIPAGGRPVLYAGCRSDQTSADATFDGRSSGAFTYFLLQALAANPDATRAEIHKALTKSLTAASFSQRPTLEGPPKAKKVALGQPW